MQGRFNWHDPNEQKPHPGARNIALFSTDDELIGHEFTKKNAAQLQSLGYEILWGNKFGHRCNEQACKQIKQALQPTANGSSLTF